MVSQTGRLMGMCALFIAGKPIMTAKLRWRNVHWLLFPIRLMK